MVGGGGGRAAGIKRDVCWVDQGGKLERAYEAKISSCNFGRSFKDVVWTSLERWQDLVRAEKEVLLFHCNSSSMFIRLAVQILQTQAAGTVTQHGIDM